MTHEELRAMCPEYLEWQQAVEEDIAGEFAKGLFSTKQGLRHYIEETADGCEWVIYPARSRKLVMALEIDNIARDHSLAVYDFIREQLTAACEELFEQLGGR